MKGTTFNEGFWSLTENALKAIAIRLKSGYITEFTFIFAGMSSPIDFVLLIDDDSITNFYNSMIIGKHSAYERVAAVQGGQEALDFLENCITQNLPLPNLIFLDLNMPGMNGWEFLDAFEQMEASITENVKVILLSTSSDPEEVNKSLNNYDVDDYINKPLSIKMLDQVFDNHFSVQHKK